MGGWVGVKIEDIIAIKGPIGYELNKAFIDEYKAKALLTKDSGERGGALEKAKAALDSNIKLIIVEKPKVDYGRCFSILTPKSIRSFITFFEGNTL